MPSPLHSQSPPLLTIDLLARVLHQSLFHPFIAWLILLSLCAVSPSLPSIPRLLASPSLPLSIQDTKILLAAAWATLVSAAWLLAALSDWIAYGGGAPAPAPRARESGSGAGGGADVSESETDEDDDDDDEDPVVVITGGSGGLGRVLVQMFAMRGASVAVLDVRDPTGSMEGEARVGEEQSWQNVRWYPCDVGDCAAVERVREVVENNLGTPSILINNAGIVNGKPLWKLSATEVSRNFNINLVSHFSTIRAFLPGMLRRRAGGTIITVSSVLGKLGAAHLSDYTAAKAGLIAMHTSLRAELRSSRAPRGAERIRTILVTPGQLATPLFGKVKTPSQFFGPVVEPVEMAREILKLVDRGTSGDISAPLYAKWIEWLAILPVGVQWIVRWLCGVDRAMEDAMVEIPPIKD